MQLESLKTFVRARKPALTQELSSLLSQTVLRAADCVNSDGAGRAIKLLAVRLDSCTWIFFGHEETKDFLRGSVDAYARRRYQSKEQVRHRYFGMSQ